MTLDEINGWYAYYAYKADKQEKAEAKQSGNLAKMDPDDVIAMFGGGNE